MAFADVPKKFWETEVDDLTDAKTRRQVKSYIKNLDLSKREGIGIYFAGGNGVGKSMAASIILKAAIREGYEVKFTSLAEVVQMFCDGMYDKNLRDEFRREILEVDFLVLDDIDKQYKSKNSDFMDSTYDTLFRQRCNNNLPVILTSNVQIDEFWSQTDNIYGVSLLSLFKEHVQEIVVTGKDRRKAVQKKLMEDIFNGAE